MNIATLHLIVFMQLANQYFPCLARDRLTSCDANTISTQLYKRSSVIRFDVVTTSDRDVSIFPDIYIADGQSESYCPNVSYFLSTAQLRPTWGTRGSLRATLFLSYVPTFNSSYQGPYFCHFSPAFH